MQKIGQNVAELVEDGSTIQVGVGAVIPSVLRALSTKNRLRIRSGILPEDVRVLVEAGVVIGKCVANVTGAYSYDFYEWLRDNTSVEIKTLEHTHNILLLCRQPKFTAIGSAVSIDLLGQAACETIGTAHITGVGGALDFARAADLGGGKRILAMPSTYRKGDKSRIVPVLDKGDIISLTRYDADYVVTEHGIAELKYKSRTEKALGLIKVADPQHREWLEEEAKKLYFI
jgi:acyl-CoA hydrolase